MSKFDKIFEARETPEKAESGIKIKPAPSVKENRSKKTEKNSSERLEREESNIPELETRQGKQRGRPKAKRSDPTFIGFTTYIRKETHRSVKIALLQEGDGRELSQLVESLLSDWVNKRTKL